MKRVAVNLLRFVVSAAILIYLIDDVRRDDPGTFGRLLGEPKDWAALSVAWVCCVAALGIGVVRWYVLARGLGLEVGFEPMLRIGILGFALDFAALGAVGGDVFKAVMLARRLRGRSVEVAATVVADRSIGLVMLLTAAAFALSGLGVETSPVLAVVGRGIAMLAAAAWAAMAVAFVLVSLDWERRLELERFGSAGSLVRRLLDAVRMYRSRAGVLLVAALLALVTLSLNVTGFFLLSAGFPAEHPTWAEHWRIVPPALLSGVVPLPADTLGVLDYALSGMYRLVSGDRVSESLGLLVMMSYRVVSLAIAIVGLILYAGNGTGARSASRGE